MFEALLEANGGFFNPLDNNGVSLLLEMTKLGAVLEAVALRIALSPAVILFFQAIKIPCAVLISEPLVLALFG